MTTSVIDSWQRIDGWLKANAPLAWHSLHPGVSEEEIRQKEDALGVMLPEDFKASYRIHNGCSYDHLFMGWEYFWPLRLVGGVEDGIYQNPLQETRWEDQTPQFVDATRIQPVWRHPYWLTFTVSTDLGAQWCLNLAPAPLGQPGQIIWWTIDDGPGTVTFPSFETLLSTYADLLEAGFLLGGASSPSFFLDPAQIRERRIAFLRPTPAKPMLLQAIQQAWAGDDECLSVFAQVLQMGEATPEDRFLAYYGLALWNLFIGQISGEGERLFVHQWQAETQHLPETHWTRQEFAHCAHWFQ